MNQSQIRSALNVFLASNNLDIDSPHVILAGGAMALQGLDREIRDIDIWLPGLPSKLEVVVDGVEFDAKPQFDLGHWIWQKGVWDRRIRLESGLEVMDLHDVLEMKLCLNRTKDQTDIRTLRSVLNIGESACGRCWGDGCSDCGGLGYE